MSTKRWPGGVKKGGARVSDAIRTLLTVKDNLLIKEGNAKHWSGLGPELLTPDALCGVFGPLIQYLTTKNKSNKERNSNQFYNRWQSALWHGKLLSYQVDGIEQPYSLKEKVERVVLKCSDWGRLLRDKDRSQVSRCEEAFDACEKHLFKSLVGNGTLKTKLNEEQLNDVSFALYIMVSRIWTNHLAHAGEGDRTTKQNGKSTQTRRNQEQSSSESESEDSGTDVQSQATRGRKRKRVNTPPPDRPQSSARRKPASVRSVHSVQSHRSVLDDTEVSSDMGDSSASDGAAMAANFAVLTKAQLDDELLKIELERLKWKKQQYRLEAEIIRLQTNQNERDKQKQLERPGSSNRRVVVNRSLLVVTEADLRNWDDDLRKPLRAIQIKMARVEVKMANCVRLNLICEAQKMGHD